MQQTQIHNKTNQHTDKQLKNQYEHQTEHQVKYRAKLQLNRPVSNFRLTSNPAKTRHQTLKQMLARTQPGIPIRFGPIKTLQLLSIPPTQSLNKTLLMPSITGTMLMSFIYKWSTQISILILIATSKICLIKLNKSVKLKPNNN